MARPAGKKDTYPVAVAYLHSTIMWPGVPQASDTTISDNKIKGLKMLMGPKGLQLEVPGAKGKGPLYGIVPIPNVKFVMVDAPVYGADSSEEL